MPQTWHVCKCRLKKGKVCIIGGTINQLLKLANAVNSLQLLRTVNGLQKVPKLLVVDEAGMMLFPHLLALSTSLLDDQSQLLLGGDHMQLEAILKHDFSTELRPALLKYPAYLSAYSWVWRMAEHGKYSGRPKEHQY